MDKRSLRKEIIGMRDQLLPDQIIGKSASIADNLYSLPVYAESKMIMFFLSFGSEVATLPMVDATIKRGKQAIAPKAVPQDRIMIPSLILDISQDLRPGAYGIPEPSSDAMRPVDPEEIDLILVPGVAFDMSGNRLGYGGGYYDRFFELLRPDVALLALAFELQIVKRVPVEKWDRRIDTLITEKRILNFK